MRNYTPPQFEAQTEQTTFSIPNKIFIFFNSNKIDILFRDIFLALASLALAWDARRA